MDESAEDLSPPDPPSWESPLCPPPWVFTHRTEQSPRDPPSLPGAPPMPWPRSDVVKQGYLGGPYFVLRAGSHTGPSRLEWYKNLHKFTAAQRNGGRAALGGSGRRGAIYLRDCLGVSRVCSTRGGHRVALFSTERTVELVAGGRGEQEEWYLALRKVMEEERGGGEEDDGYCTLPPAFSREVWPVTVRPRGLGGSRSLAGESRLCLTPSSLVLVRVGVSGGSPSATIPLLGVRRFGHSDGAFYLELGRSAPGGAGEVWMEAKGQAQSIHEAVRDAVAAMRVLPSFDHSRPKSGGVAPGPRLATPTGDPGSPGSKPSLSGPPASHQISMETGAEPRPGGMEDWGPGEGEGGLGYMMMSPQARRGSASSLPNDYVVMVSPRKPDWPARCAPQAPIDSPAPLCLAGLCPSPPRAGGRDRGSEAGQSQPSGERRSPSTTGGRSRLSLCLPRCLRDDTR